MDQVKERVATDAASGRRTYRTLLVHAEAGLEPGHRAELGARLARAFDAHLIGLAAETFDAPPAADPISALAMADWYAAMQERVTKDLKAAETAFRRDAAGADIEWRAVKDYPARALVRAARAADLIIVGQKAPENGTRYPDPAEVVMAAGRPVLVAPRGRNHLRAEAIVVAWKDTRECRRAIADAMPFLQAAKTVLVHGVAPRGEKGPVKAEVEDVASYLRRHGVAARQMVTVAANGTAEELERVARVEGADLIVCGAYGHNRLREWAFGGVTEHFLRGGREFVMMSH
ncbi:universal stress protein [Phenylobacterium immobile]|uniref:universal stress protein n=1 Tax=Phenylobacterium immobile TaxID=21 RepID=UPI000ADDBE9D|nr:universal stress protein [Phenylobacterium immobile]